MGASNLANRGMIPKSLAQLGPPETSHIVAAIDDAVNCVSWVNVLMPLGSTWVYMQVVL